MAACAALCIAVSGPPCQASDGTAQAAPVLPAWLLPRPGTLVRVDNAPWLDSDEPEAALTASARSLRRDFTADGTRPEDIVYEPVGVRARIVRLAAGGLVLLHGTDRPWMAFAPLSQLVPDIPPGTALVVAGGFAGFADFYPTLTASEASAGRLATGTHLVTETMRVAPPSPGRTNRVRVRVRVVSGPSRDKNGWLEVPFTGIAERKLSPNAPMVERACSCRLLSFVS